MRTTEPVKSAAESIRLRHLIDNRDWEEGLASVFTADAVFDATNVRMALLNLLAIRKRG